MTKIPVIAVLLLASTTAPAKERDQGVPTVVPGSADVRGSLDKELIRRIVRRHLRDVNACYEKGLKESPSIQGRVMAYFVISSTGAVKEALKQSSTLDNPVVEECLIAAIKSWEFPKPQEGEVSVTYPFVFLLK